MDEERSLSFYAPKKLFQRRVHKSLDSLDDSSVNPFSDSDFGVYSVSSLSPSYLNGIASPVSNCAPNTCFRSNLEFSSSDSSRCISTDDSNSFTSNLLNGLSEDNQRCYRIVNSPSSNGYISHRIGHRVPDIPKHPPIDTTFIKTEPDDLNEYCSYFPSKAYSSCDADYYSNKNLSSRHYIQYADVQTEPEDLTVKKTRSLNCELIKDKLGDEHKSPFFEKFSQIVKSLRSQITEEVPEERKQRKSPIHYSRIKNEKDFSLLKFSLSDVKLEAMDPSCSDATLTELAPVMAKFDDQVSSTNFGFETGVNSLNMSPTDNRGDFHNVTNMFMVNSGDSVNKVTSSEQNSDEGTSNRKQGKKWMKGDMICQVCGDKAAGFYCGAFACEACKKFFMRSCRNDKTKYVCLRDKKCLITAESRVQCQYCRLQKCLSLNMYSPGSDTKKENVGDIPCRVCSAPSSGFHFGALTCEGCKGFFRRMAKERELGKYRCSKTGACEINTSTRNLCKSCRYKKCIEAGMSIEGSRIGRQPNAVKYAISMEVKNQNGEIMDGENNKVGFTLKDLSNSTQGSESPESVQNKRPHGRSIETGGSTAEKLCRVDVKNRMSPEEYESVMKWVSECDKDLQNITLPKRDSERNILLLTDVGEIWEEIVKPFYYHSSVIIKFAKKCQPFRKLSLEDQVRMLQQALYPVSILNHSRFYILETKQYSYFGWNVVEREHIWKYFPFYRVLGEHFENTGDNVKLLGLDDKEFTILSALVLLNPDVPGLSDKEKIRQLQADILDFLEYYISVNYPDQPSRYGLILVRLSELNFYAFQHLEGVREMLRVYPFLTMPQLYREMFINL